MLVGVPQTGGKLVAAAREFGYPVLFSANAFADAYPEEHDRAYEFRKFHFPDPEQFDGLEAHLDSAGFVAAVKYRDYRWTINNYLDLVASHPWVWWAAMDYCCEREIAQDRPLRLLRIAATVHMLGKCQVGAARRGLPPPLPVLQGWTPDEYALCAKWFGMREWPKLIGIGSVCRRPVHGSTGVLAILQALDAILPQHVQVHLFGVKSEALEVLTRNKRVASVDSMAWDVRARAERRTGRDAAFRIGHMKAWATKQQAIAARQGGGVGMQRMLFNPDDFGGFTDMESLALEALTLQFADLVMGGEIDYLDAVVQSRQDGVIVMALLRNKGLSDATLADFDEVIEGLGDRVEELQKKAA